MLNLTPKTVSLLCFKGRFLSSNIFLMVVDKKAVAIDCGMPWTAKRVLNHLNKNHLKLEYIFLTHSHFDHVMGMNRLKDQTSTKVITHLRNKKGDVKVKDGAVIKVADNKLSFLVIYTGTHKDDHVWYYEKNTKVLFIGDLPPRTTRLKTLMEKREVEPKILAPGHGIPPFPPNLIL